MSNSIRVRFAPSPTGPLHIGGVRTALYNYLFARSQGGIMILRIEDTDQLRFVKGAEEYIMESLSWCGIQIDEGIREGGPYAPYRQSDRKEIYGQYVRTLIESGHAYIAFDSPEELDAARKEAESRKATFQYDSKTRMKMKNALSMSSYEVESRIGAGDPYVVRFRIPENEEVVVEDIIRGTVRVDSNTLDDKVLFKSDGMPTYHLANVVDDYLMKISHVIRGEEWLPSAPLHVLLYRSLGWAGEMPRFAHLPLLLKPDGNGKLSKRDGDRLGFPVFPLQWTDPKSGEVSSGYRESGYFPEAFINMIALLGWNPGTEQELFSMEELSEIFSLERVGKSGARFDPEKAKWFNHQYLVKMSDDEIAVSLGNLLNEKNINADSRIIRDVALLIRPRLNFLNELWSQSFYFFIPPQSIDPKAFREKWKPGAQEALLKVKEIIAGTDPFDADMAKSGVMEFISSTGLNTGMVMNALRLLIVGASTGPDLFGIIRLIGKNETLSRITHGLHLAGDMQHKG